MMAEKNYLSFFSRNADFIPLSVARFLYLQGQYFYLKYLILKYAHDRNP